MTTDPSNGIADLQKDVEIVDDVARALEVAEEHRVVVTRTGHAPIAVIPIDDLRLLLRLEEAEMDRIDTHDVRQIKETDEYLDRVAWEDVKAVSRV